MWLDLSTAVCPLWLYGKPPIMLYISISKELLPLIGDICQSFLYRYFHNSLTCLMCNYRISLLRTQSSYSLKPWICINGTQQQNLVFQILKNKIHPCARFYFILFYMEPLWLFLAGPLLMSTLLRWFYIVSNWHLKLTMTPPSNAISSGTKAPHLLLLLSINFFSNQPVGDGGSSFGCAGGSSYCQLFFFSPIDHLQW